MDTSIVAFGLVCVGAVFMLIIPALLKMKEEGQDFKLSYLWGLGVTVVFGAFAILPEDNIVITFRTGMLLVLSGAGLQGLFNMTNAKRIKRKNG